MIVGIVAVVIGALANLVGCLVSVRLDRTGLPSSIDAQFAQRRRGAFPPRLPRIFMNLLGQWVGIAVGFFVLASYFPVAWPGWLTVALQALVVLLVDDTSFYWGHRTLHRNPWLYKNVHRIHHEANAPVPLEYIYVHPVEQMVGAFGILSGFLIVVLLWGSLSAWVIWLYMGFRVLHELIIHSGARLPLLPLPFFVSTRDHDLHHARPGRGNYASLLRWWDWLLRTQSSDGSVRPTARPPSDSCAEE